MTGNRSKWLTLRLSRTVCVPTILLIHYLLIANVAVYQLFILTDRRDKIPSRPEIRPHDIPRLTVDILRNPDRTLAFINPTTCATEYFGESKRSM